MESDFTDLLDIFVRQAEPDLNSRLEAQAESLTGLKCTEPVLGKWVDEHDVEYMLAAFALDDDDFVATFPSMANITEDDRNRIIEAFEKHFEYCPHCSRKRNYDLEYNSRVERVFQQKRAELLHHLSESPAETESEEEHKREAVLIAAHD